MLQFRIEKSPAAGQASSLGQCGRAAPRAEADPYSRQSRSARPDSKDVPVDHHGDYTCSTSFLPLLDSMGCSRVFGVSSVLPLSQTAISGNCVQSRGPRDIRPTTTRSDSWCRRVLWPAIWGTGAAQAYADLGNARTGWCFWQGQEEAGSPRSQVAVDYRHSMMHSESLELWCELPGPRVFLFRDDKSGYRNDYVPIFDKTRSKSRDLIAKCFFSPKWTHSNEINPSSIRLDHQKKLRFFSFCYALCDNMRGPKKDFLHEKTCSIERSPSVDNSRYPIFFLTLKIEKVMTVWKKCVFFLFFRGP